MTRRDEMDGRERLSRNCLTWAQSYLDLRLTCRLQQMCLWIRQDLRRLCGHKSGWISELKAERDQRRQYWSVVTGRRSAGSQVFCSIPRWSQVKRDRRRKVGRTPGWWEW